MENKTFDELVRDGKFANIVLINYNRGMPTISQETANDYYQEALQVQEILHTKYKSASVVRTPVRLENKIKKQ